MNYTIQARTPEQWGRAFLKLLEQCEEVSQVNELQDVHEKTFIAVRKTKPEITDYIEDQCKKRRSILAQKP